MGEGLQLEAEDLHLVEAVEVHLFQVIGIEKLGQKVEGVFFAAEDQEKRGRYEVHALDVA